MKSQKNLKCTKTNRSTNKLRIVLPKQTSTMKYEFNELMHNSRIKTRKYTNY